MLKAGDWIEILYNNFEKDYHMSKFQKIKSIDAIFGDKNNDNCGKVYWVYFENGARQSLNSNYFRIITPEEVKSKGLDEKSNFVPQNPNDGVKTVSQNKNRKQKQPYTKFLFVEEGSVDTDSLEKDLKKHNPEIKIVVYRQGAQMPQLVDIKEQQ